MYNLEKLTDEEIVQITRTKDKTAYSQIIKRYQNKLLRYAKYLVGDEEKAKDIVQEAFIKSYINLNGFNTSKKFSSWIYRIVHNEAINLVYKYKKEIVNIKDFDFESNENIEEDFSKEELKSQVQNCIDELPISYKIPLTLYALEEKSYTEISDILRIPLNTVGTRISRAKKIMKKICLTKATK